MLPVKKPMRRFQTLEELRLRKEELASEIQQDSTKFSALWKQSITAIDAFLLVRKLIKNYGSLFGKTSKKSKKKH